MQCWQWILFIITAEESTEYKYLDFMPVAGDLADALFVTEGWTNSSGSSANKLLLLDMVDGLADAALRLLAAGVASNEFDGLAADLPTAGSYTHPVQYFQHISPNIYSSASSVRYYNKATI